MRVSGLRASELGLLEERQIDFVRPEGVEKVLDFVDVSKTLHVCRDDVDAVSRNELGSGILEG